MSYREQRHEDLEQFKKNCSHAGREEREAVFLSYGFVSAQSQVAADMLLPSQNYK